MERTRSAALRTSVRLAAGVALAIGVLPASAQVIRQVTDTKTTSIRITAMDDTGTDVFVGSTADPFGTNPNHAFQIFRYATSTGSGVQVTSFADGIDDGTANLSVSDDGQWLAFITRGNFTGQNHDRSPELFTMARDGTSLTQITNDPGPNAGAVVMAAMAGGGAKVAFVSSSNPTGANPSHAQQVFLVNRNGTGMTRVTSFTDAEITYLTVSDDATKIAFSSDADPFGTNSDGNYDLFAINGDGTGLRQLTATTGADVYEDSIVWPQLAGGGSKIAFQSNRDLLGTNADLGPEIFVINWDGTGLRQLTDSRSPLGQPTRDSEFPGITDDGVTVYFTSDQGTFSQNSDGSYELWKIKTDGTGRTMLENLGLYGVNLVLSGSGNRLSFDTLSALEVIDATGLNLKTLQTETSAASDSPAISPDGTVLLFGSSANLTGANADGSAELFRVQPDGTGLTQISNNVDIYQPSIGNDDATIVFSSNSNPTGGNAAGNFEIFRMNVNGTGYVQLTSVAAQYTQDAVVSANGSAVVFTSSGDLTGGNPDGSPEIFKMNADGSGVVQLSSGPGPGLTYYSYFPRVDASGTWVAFSGNDNLDGGNADHSFEVWRVRTDGTGLQRLTTDAVYSSADPDISPDGTKVVYSSNADPVGTNADHDTEIFLYDATAGTTRQLTFTRDALQYYPRFSPDGSLVYFFSNATLLEAHHRSGHELYRVALATGQIERVDGLGLGTAYGQLDTDSAAEAVGPAGRVLFSAKADAIGRNLDKNREIFLVDPATAPGIRIGSGPAPTVISWDGRSGAVRYDVVRGDVHNLHVSAGIVDLGAVVCVEDDSADLDTAGNADPTTPLPGQAFFYVVRGTQGVSAGPGSYGQGSGGRERTAGAGDCQP